jgi:filamentous hemagglutinin
MGSDRRIPASSSSWPPRVRELLPRGDEAVGVRHKLTTYALNVDHPHGASKAKGFASILQITLEDLDYLEARIQEGLLYTPISTIRQNRPFGVNCVIDIPVRGIGAKIERVAAVRTIWELADANAAPRLVSAYIKV